MQNIKNFQMYTPSPEQVAEDLEATGKVYRYLKSEDGQDWYQCQELFSDTTVKLTYDKDNIIHSVVAAPVPERGNTYAVSMFFPDNMSVAEISGQLPEGFELDSLTWVFDGESIYQDEVILNNSVRTRNKKKRDKLMMNAAAWAFSIQSSAALGKARAEDANDLVSLQSYADKLRDVDISQPNLSWPDVPEFLN